MEKPNKVSIVVGSILLIFLACILFIVLLPYNFESKYHDKTADWGEYYQNVVSKHFKLPHVAEVVDAVHVDSAIMGMRFEIKFRLPNTQPPERWLDNIAAESGIAEGFKRSPYSYDCLDQCDLYELKYNPDSKLYYASYGWD